METKVIWTPQTKREKMIEDVINNFNFESCHRVMQSLNWTWAGIGIPTVEDLKNSARNRINNAIEGLLDKENRLSSRDYYYSSSGGLKATAHKNRYGHLSYIMLEFVLTDWESDGD